MDSSIIWILLFSMFVKLVTWCTQKENASIIVIWYTQRQRKHCYLAPPVLRFGLLQSKGAQFKPLTTRLQKSKSASLTSSYCITRWRVFRGICTFTVVFIKFVINAFIAAWGLRLAQRCCSLLGFMCRVVCSHSLQWHLCLRKWERKTNSRQYNSELC